jgi:hypothetical protein
MKIIQAFGQIANQLWIYSNYIADAIEDSSFFYVLVPDEVIFDLSIQNKNNYICFPLMNEGLIRVFCKKS